MEFFPYIVLFLKPDKTYWQPIHDNFTILKKKQNVSHLSVLLFPVVAVLAIYYFLTTYPIPVTSPTVAKDSLALTLLQATAPAPEPTYLFGINVDTLEVVEATIQPNEYLSQILRKYNISLGLIDRLAKKSRDVFDVRKIRTSKNYTILCRPDSAHTAQYFIYEPNRLDYVVFDLTDTVSIYQEQHEIDTLVQEFSGIIDYSIYQTLADGNAPPDLAYQLSDIYAWQLDLFKVQKGDRFKMIYEEIRIKNEPVGVGRVLAAHFERDKESYYAFYYNQQGRTDYFDEVGNSLRKAFLKAPLKYTRISSRFSNSRLHPVLHIRRPHHGIDYAAPKGTPVRAVGDGKVIKANYSGGAGNFVKIRHNNTYTTGYMHLSKYGEDIKVGQRVKQGDIIGYVGSTGISTGPHLDYRVWKNGKAVDALSIEMPPSEPIKRAHRTSYEAAMQALTDRLSQMQYPKRQFILADAKTNVRVVNIDGETM